MRRTMAALVLAQSKLEELRALPWRFAPDGTRVSSGALSPSPGNSLTVDQVGWVDALDRFGASSGVRQPQTYRRRWSIAQWGMDPDTLVLQVCVFESSEAAVAATAGACGRASHTKTMKARGISVIEVLLACALVALVGGAVAALARPLRSALARSEGNAQLEPAGRAALETIVSDLLEAGADPEVADQRWRLSPQVLPVTPLRDLDSNDPVVQGGALRVRRTGSGAAQGVLGANVVAGSTILMLETSARCAGGAPSCSFSPGDVCVLYSDDIAESVVVFAVAAGTVVLARPLTNAFGSGAVIGTVLTTSYGTRLAANGWRQLVRVSYRRRGTTDARQRGRLRGDVRRRQSSRSDAESRCACDSNRHSQPFAVRPDTSFDKPAPRRMHGSGCQMCRCFSPSRCATRQVPDDAFELASWNRTGAGAIGDRILFCDGGRAGADIARWPIGGRQLRRGDRACERQRVGVRADSARAGDGRRLERRVDGRARVDARGWRTRRTPVARRVGPRPPDGDQSAHMRPCSAVHRCAVERIYVGPAVGPQQSTLAAVHPRAVSCASGDAPRGRPCIHRGVDWR